MPFPFGAYTIAFGLRTEIHEFFRNIELRKKIYFFAPEFPSKYKTLFIFTNASTVRFSFFFSPFLLQFCSGKILFIQEKEKNNAFDEMNFEIDIFLIKAEKKFCFTFNWIRHFNQIMLCLPAQTNHNQRIIIIKYLWRRER